MDASLFSDFCSIQTFTGVMPSFGTHDQKVPKKKYIYKFDEKCITTLCEIIPLRLLGRGHLIFFSHFSYFSTLVILLIFCGQNTDRMTVQ